METGKKHEEEQGHDINTADTEKLQRNENEADSGNQYSADEGEDENGAKPSADEQE